MGQEERSLFGCPYGFYYDSSSTKHCVPCDSVCGGTGLSPDECRTHCPYYNLTSLRSTILPDVDSKNGDNMILPPTPLAANGFDSHFILLITTILSLFLALVTVSLLTSFIWRRRKEARREIVCESSLDTEHGMLVVSASEDDRSQYRTELPLSFGLHSMSANYSNLSNNIMMNFTEKDGLPRVPTSASYTMDVDEEESTISTKLADVRRQSSCHSAISLRSDGSLMDPAAELRSDTYEGCHHAPSQPTDVSSVISNILQMFGWLNKTDWVKEYSGGENCVHIGVEGIGKSFAEDTIRKKGRNLPNCHFVVKNAEPTPGHFVPCPNPNGGQRSNAETINSSDHKSLRPGAVIYSPQMEPDLVTTESTPGYAIYSGTIGGMPVEHGHNMGITVGHLFRQVDIEASTGPGQPPIGCCVIKHEVVKHRVLDRMTADLALVRVQLQTQNVIDIVGVPFQLKLFKGKLESMSQTEVIIQRRDGNFAKGIIAESMFTYKKSQILNTLRIIESKESPKRITNEGDSGSLVLSMPQLSAENAERFLYVYGMVIGYWVSDDMLRSHTVATRLWDILETIGETIGATHDEVDFCHDTNYGMSAAAAAADSGYVSNIP